VMSATDTSWQLSSSFQWYKNPHIININRIFLIVAFIKGCNITFYKKEKSLGFDGLSQTSLCIGSYFFYYSVIAITPL
jgi:uncharacterized protein YdeI (YjbR/CyaY-like superfamily)